MTTASREWLWLLGSVALAAVCLPLMPAVWFHFPGSVWTVLDVHEVGHARTVIAAAVLAAAGGLIVYAIGRAVRWAFGAGRTKLPSA